ncbi:Pycsar system effector family protein [Allosalinactinospora lopnorensis]|uniref:Pycsar system effector family protein n=1 Tax=Allosalinactinospora lopnorensis TaxID=1352348 RepID=UPI000623BCEE|nr:Pycsar system effector family protein [Allosalinactinospora lopnorensis]
MKNPQSPDPGGADESTPPPQPPSGERDRPADRPGEDGRWHDAPGGDTRQNAEAPDQQSRRDDRRDNEEGHYKDGNNEERLRDREEQRSFGSDRYDGERVRDSRRERIVKGSVSATGGDATFGGHYGSRYTYNYFTSPFVAQGLSSAPLPMNGVESRLCVRVRARSDTELGTRLKTDRLVFLSGAEDNGRRTSAIAALAFAAHPTAERPLRLVHHSTPLGTLAGHVEDQDGAAGSGYLLDATGTARLRETSVTEPAGLAAVLTGALLTGVVSLSMLPAQAVRPSCRTERAGTRWRAVGGRRRVTGLLPSGGQYGGDHQVSGPLSSEPLGGALRESQPRVPRRVRFRPVRRGARMSLVRTWAGRIGGFLAGGPPGDRRPSLEDRIRSHALALLDDARKEVAQADQKASILLAAVGVVVSVFLGALLDGKWSPAEVKAPWQWLWWTGVAAFGTAMLMFAMVVFPRLGPRRASRGTEISSFIEVARCADKDELRRSLERPCAADLGDVLSQLYKVSRIVYRKYMLLRSGLVLLAPAAACSAAAALGSALV